MLSEGRGTRSKERKFNSGGKNSMKWLEADGTFSRLGGSDVEGDGTEVNEISQSRKK